MNSIQSQPFDFFSLDREIQLLILENLTTREKVEFCFVSKSFCSLCCDEYLWKTEAKINEQFLKMFPDIQHKNHPKDQFCANKLYIKENSQPAQRKLGSEAKTGNLEGVKALCSLGIKPKLSTLYQIDPGKKKRANLSDQMFEAIKFIMDNYSKEFSDELNSCEKKVDCYWASKALDLDREKFYSLKKLVEK